MRLISAFIFILFFVSGCSSEKPSYKQLVKSQRAFKDIQFKGDDSPLPEGLRLNFKGLKYFSPKPSFNVKAEVEWDFDVNEIQLYKNPIEGSKHYPVAKLSFVLDNKTFVLTGFSNELDVPKVLFIPFYDETSGGETYGGGRYVDVLVEDTNVVVIDFNKAYNPYCVYNHNYTCAVPPFANDLKTKILAGEKLPFIDEH